MFFYRYIILIETLIKSDKLGTSIIGNKLSKPQRFLFDRELWFKANVENVNPFNFFRNLLRSFVGNTFPICYRKTGFPGDLNIFTCLTFTFVTHEPFISSSIFYLQHPVLVARSSLDWMPSRVNSLYSDVGAWSGKFVCVHYFKIYIKPLFVTCPNLYNLFLFPETSNGRN